MREINGARVLWLLRQGLANDWASLCGALGLGDSADSLAFILRRVLDDLREIGLVEFELEGNHRREKIAGAISLSPAWPKLQLALGISLAEVAKFNRRSMIVNPIFGKPDLDNRDFPGLFVLMPFNASLKAVYDDHIQKVAANLNITARRADDIFTTHSVIKDVWEAICGARIIVADCTGRNPNVFYEIGLAHTLGKPVVLITQNKEDVPFDLSSIRYIEYEFTPRGMAVFEDRLLRTLKEELAFQAE